MECRTARAANVSPRLPAKGGGMSPIMMALLGLLAYKAMKGGGLAVRPAAPPASSARYAHRRRRRRAW